MCRHVSIAIVVAVNAGAELRGLSHFNATKPRNPSSPSSSSLVRAPCCIVEGTIDIGKLCVPRMSPANAV